MSDGYCFISYSNGDADDFGPQLADELEGGHPYIDTWLDKRNILPGHTWDEKVPEAIKTCKCLLFVMTKDSVADNSICAEELDWALRYKKPILILRLQSVESPFRLGKRQWIDFSNNHKAAMAKLRQAIRRLDLPEGQLDVLKDRFADANRDLERAQPGEKTRIQSDLDAIKEEIKTIEQINKDPEKARKQTRKNINAGLERDRQPLNPTGGKSSSKFINPRPGSIPDYFEGRLIETEEIADFLKNDYQRIMTIVGRAGGGKTVLACRVLQGLENGVFPNDIGEFKVGGIIYLSEISNYKVTVANIFAGLLQLIEPGKAEKLEQLYREARLPTDEKIRALLAALPQEPVVLLLDNFENLLSDDGVSISDQELQIALTTILQAPLHSLKVLITTRILPRDFSLVEPGRHCIKHLEEGLKSPFAENVLRKMDKDGSAGFRDASEELLGRVREATLGYPRALEAFYGIMRVDRYTSIEELLEHGLPETVVEKLVGEAFSRLDITSQKIMQALAAFNRPVSSAAIDFALQQHVFGINSAPILDRLVSMHFVRREAKRYFLHPVDQEYAFSRVPVGEADKKVGQGARSRIWDQHALILRAADYFTEVRKPRAEWKTLDDLAAQLAEFDLRCAAGDYDAAASVLREFDFDYLLLWGHYRLMIQMYEKVQAKLQDANLKMGNLNGLGLAYRELGNARKSILYFEQGIPAAQGAKNRQAEGAFLGNLGEAYTALGEVNKAIEFHEQSIIIAREIGDRGSESGSLGSLGSAYVALGNVTKAMEFYEQALAINREISNRRGEETDIGNMGNAYADLGEANKAIEFHEQSLLIAREIGHRGSESVSLGSLGLIFLSLEEYQQAIGYMLQAIQLADEISFPQIQNYARWCLAQAYLFQNDLTNARAASENALQYDVPENNHNATALHGIILLRMRDLTGLSESRPDGKGSDEDLSGLAVEDFTRAIVQADEILAKTPEYYSALDAKGLALCGLILVDRGDPSGSTEAHDQPGRVAPTIEDAITTFREARKIAPHAGVVKRVLRLFDELAQCDPDGLLKDVRPAAAGEA
ncbi:MAG TPA: hypothetical protein DCG54_10285 [Anaerolineae bacterium]|jgi:tetratricopeptide (TPR) repeat protein|nr:hypothetical protein [Anaerolineae bacterium]